MKLVSIELNNFRQFYGKQQLDFSISKTKNITLIHGENNGGKTALLNAIRWCLYEDLTHNLLDPINLINKHAQAKGVKEFYVHIRLIHDSKLFEIRRKMSATRRVSLKVYCIENGNYSEDKYISQSNPQFFINSILPKDMVEFFFYQGEGTGTLNSANDFQSVQSSIEKILGFTVAKKTIARLKRIRNTIGRDIAELDVSGESTRLVTLKEVLEREIETGKNKLLKFNENENTAEKQLTEVNKKIVLSDIDEVRRRAKSRLAAFNSIKSMKEQKNFLESDKCLRLSSWLIGSYSEKISNIDLSKINTNELKEKLTYSIDKILLQEIMEQSKCICGSNVSVGTIAREILDNLSKYAVEPDLKVRWKKANDLLERSKKAKNNPKSQMRTYLNKIAQCNKDIEEQKSIYDELDTQIKDINIDELSKLEEQRDSLIALKRATSTDLAREKAKLEQVKLDLLDTEELLHRISLTAPQEAKLNEHHLTADRLILLFENELSNAKDGVENVLLAKMQLLFAQVAFNGYTIAKDGNGAWKIIDASGQNVAAGNGYQAMLAISFIVALIQFSSDRLNDSRYLLTPGTVCPFIADSILAFIGPDNGRELVKFIANSVEQSVFMFSQAQWTESHTDVGIRDKIGKEYNLVQHTILTEEEFTGSYPTKLSVQNKQYDVVIFGSEFDKVTIEEVI